MVESEGNAPGSEFSNQQLNFNFPRHSFGKTKIVHRLFQSKWFQQWLLLHYDQSRDLAFCLTYVQAMHEEWEDEGVNLE